MADDGCATSVVYTGSEIEALFLKHGYTREPPPGVQQSSSPIPTYASLAEDDLTPEELRDIHGKIVSGQHKLEDYPLNPDELSYIQQLSVTKPQQTSPMPASLAQEANGSPALTNPRRSPSYHQGATPSQTQQADTYQMHQDYQYSAGNFSSTAQQPARQASRAPMQPQYLYSQHENSSRIQQPNQQANRGTRQPQNQYSTHNATSMVQLPAQQAHRGPIHPRHQYPAHMNCSKVQQPTERNSCSRRPPHQFPPYTNSSMIYSSTKKGSNMSQAMTTSRPAQKRTFDQASHSNTHHIDNSNYALGDVLPMSDYPPMEGPGRPPTPQPNGGSARKRQRRAASTKTHRPQLPIPQKYNPCQAQQQALMPPPRVQRPTYDHLAPELRPNPYRQPRPAQYAWFQGLDYTQQVRVAHSGLLFDPLPEWPSLEGIEDLMQLQTAPAAVIDNAPATRADKEAAVAPASAVITEVQNSHAVPAADGQLEADVAPASAVITEAQNSAAVPAADGQLEGAVAPASAVITEAQNSAAVPAADGQLEADVAPASGVVTEVRNSDIVPAADEHQEAAEAPATVVAPQDVGVLSEQVFDFDVQEDYFDNPFAAAMENWFQDFD